MSAAADARRAGALPVPPGESLLSVRDLRVQFVRRGAAPVTAVDGVSFDVGAGEILGLVGESGCGKSVTSLAVMGLLPRRSSRVSGEVRFAGRDLLTLPQQQLRDLRGRELGMVFQDPMTSLNPVLTLGTQVTEVLRRHEGMGRREARERAADLLRGVGIPDPARRLGEYPHQLSGGMRQRALIAIALACRPRLLIADEPTTALDVTIQAQVLDLLQQLVRESGTAMVLITHDLGVVAGLCDRVDVLYAGRVVESANRRDLFAAPRHRYTQGLLGSVPRTDANGKVPLTPIPGSVRDMLPWADGCAFLPRCHRGDDACRTAGIDLEPRAGADAASTPPHRARCVHPAGLDDAPGPAGAQPAGAHAVARPDGAEVRP
ncbi:peptide/nickel transport system ATP-binding protein [Kineococcus xinjiangensis]|uniref:Peptide/nickel transport system ATP-binding protein n=1 Tax=Kineococcus xinjiangensis TaxID=512762 RepID=A0A2S6IPD5_9ACTN|nr:ABC transporter ATP-binding protein [Kineococcus xinjiangensis]PPK96041.1 peptide/nickel transport system ATP-binding protein [Kineococcus xinjiangensis]